MYAAEYAKELDPEGVERAAKALLRMDDPNGTLRWDRLEGRERSRYTRRAEKLVASYLGLGGGQS